MAIYRSDQATVTFAAEAGQGGAPEIAAASSSTNITSPTILAINPGDRTVTFSAATAAMHGDLKTMIIIGSPMTSATANDPRELRRVVDGCGTAVLTVDVPFAFAHPAAAAAGFDEIEADGTAYSIGATGNVLPAQLITQFPGVYESVDCPDPEQAFEPRYVLGGLTNRNFYQMYAGNETLTGSMGGMVMLNGFPLRFPIGKVVTVPTNAFTWSSGWQMAAASSKGDMKVSIKIASAAAMVTQTYIMFGLASDEAPASGTNYGYHVSDSTKTYEIRQVIGGFTSATSGRAVLNAPLHYAHAENERIAIITVSASTYFQHTIFEQVALPSLTWNVNVVDDNGVNAWQRRYVGGKVGSMTLSAESGGLLTGGWDGVNFLDMVHNMKAHPDLPANQPLPRWAAMLEIGSDKVGQLRQSSGQTIEYIRPVTAPYYYSQGSIKMFGDGHPHTVTATTEAELARIASFSLSISNSTEPKYYVGAQYDGRRAPKEQFEGNREYTMSASIGTNDSANQGTDDTRNLFKELLLAGDYRGTTAATGFRGFGIQLKFTRDLDGSSNDYILIDIPGDGTAAAGGNEQGAFIRAAPHNIGEDSPILADADIVFRSMRVKIKDQEPMYP